MAISQWFTAWSPAGMGLQERALAVPRPQAWAFKKGHLPSLARRHGLQEGALAVPWKMYTR